MRLYLIVFPLFLSVTLATFVRPASAENGAENGAPALERAQGERLAAATGHYARSRALLLSAIHEFDQGNKLANPDSIIDSKAWRDSLIGRAEDLNHILDPQPRASKGGVKYNADPRLLNQQAEEVVK
jgi:hypothetical protein